MGILVTQTAHPRIAIIGCGAIARSFHLPALMRHPEIVRSIILVDRDAGRARELGAAFGIQRTATNYAEILAEVDGVIVTVPHHLHYQISIDCLQAGKHVLCEKPLAASPREVREMIAVAEMAGVTLSANHTRRLYPVTQRIHQLLNEGAIGELRQIQFFWGEAFDWPAASGFYFGIGGAPHGVLFDKGPHALDLICWWLNGKPEVVSCRDDSFGGGEAMISLTLEKDRCTVDCQFSFLSRYPNTYSLVGDAGRIDAALFEFRSFDLVSKHGTRRKIKLDTTAKSIGDFGPLMIDNFMAVIRGAARPLVPATEALNSVALIDECYSRRERYEMPWHESWRRLVHA